jgi:hypothetical protein
MFFHTIRRKDQIFALVAFSSFGTFVFLGLVPAHIYPKLLESMFVYMMFFIFLFLIFVGCYGEMKGWSDPSQPRHLKRLKKSDLKKSRRLLGINENAVVSSSGGDNRDQGHDVETGFDSLQVPIVANPPSLLERCLPCLRRHGSIHPSEMSEKRRLTESQRRSYERCRELSNKRRPSIGGRHSCCCDLMRLFLPKSSDDLARVYPLEPTSTDIGSTPTTSTNYSINNSDNNRNGCIEVKVEKETSPQVSEKVSQEVEVESVDKPPPTTTTTPKGKDVDRIVNVKSKSSGESRIESTETDENADKKKKKLFDDDSNDSSNFDVTDFDHDR